MKIESAISNARAFLRFRKSSEHFGPTLGVYRWPPKTKPVEKRRRHSRDHAGIRRVQQGSQGAGIFRLLVPRWFMPTCRRPAWSMTTPSIASDTRKFYEMTPWHLTGHFVVQPGARRLEGHLVPAISGPRVTPNLRLGAYSHGSSADAMCRASAILGSRSQSTDLRLSTKV